ncbi:MAG: Polysaccharide pyruvyl transferase [Candidatus Ozemobacter sibiricus]|uniref:Polysaccharide pyruvyl transferase n=1 Tax=Candidatus Ozemobacter sibiricus TaxID=2268124 RepID=A0A367ZTH2_9BACT|nr:MAG: Polysaccharide pyruvyl transferase [Candidatus Ozemobacter sibiricus]
MSRRRLTTALLLFLPLFLPGLLAALWRCQLRWEAERRDRFVETVLDFEEMRRLAREEGWSLAKMLEEARHQGASSIGLSEDTLATLEAEGRITVLTYEDVLELSLESLIASPTTVLPEAPGALWVHSRQEELLDRIEHHLVWKLPIGRVQRLHRHMLLIRKSSPDFRERVGVGFSPEYLDMARQAGLGVVIRVFNYPGLEAEALQQIIRSLPDPGSVSALLFAEEEILGNRGALDAAITGIYERGFRVGWVEFHDQQGMPRLLDRLKGRRPIVRVHSISRRELDEAYTVPRAVARYVRAVRDRRLKMLYIRCFFQDKKKFIGDLVQFNMAYLGHIVRELGEWGFAIPRTDDERRQEPRHLVGTLSRGERLAIGLALLLGVPLAIGAARDRWPPARDLFLTVAVAGLAWLLLPAEQFTMVTGLTGAVAVPVLTCLWAIVRLEGEGAAPTLAGAAAQAVRFLARLALPGFVGGTLIAGLHAEVGYLLHFSQFRGIKVAFLLPVLIMLVWGLRRFGSGFFTLLARPLTIREGLLIMAVLAASLLYLLRSGNVTFLKPGEWEDLGRTFLENTLVARPRNKEFLVGYPAAFLFLFFWFRRQREILPILGLFMVMGQVSVVNTFCHFHSPLALAYLRGVNGLWLGLLAGMAALVGLLILRLVAALGDKDRQVLLVGYFGFGNLGDEILWRAFIAEGSRHRPDLDWLVLHRTGEAESLPPRTTLISRQSPAQLLEALAAARLVVIPGGGVLQASTSLASLLYYSLLLGIGRLAGARLGLPAQGLGPWQPRAAAAVGEAPLVTALARLVARLVIDGASYFSVRDGASLAEAQHLPGPPRDPPRTADLAFLLATPADPAKAAPDTSGDADRPATTTDRLRLGVILRGSCPDGAALARRLAGLSARLENLDLVPLALQAPEDLAPWADLELPPRHGPPTSATPAAGTPAGEATAGAVEPGDHALDRPVAARPRLLATPEEALTALQEIDILLSMRLHGCLLATLAGVPWIGVEVDPKIRGLGEDCRWPHVYPAAELLDDDRLIARLDELMTQRRAAAAHLRAEAAARRRLAAEDVRRCLQALPAASASAAGRAPAAAVPPA